MNTFQTPIADTVILHASVLTFDEHDSIAEAVCIRDGLILHVGTADSAEQFIGQETAVVHAPQCTLIPGINDSHHHLSAASLNAPPAAIGMRPGMVHTVEQIISLVRERAAQLEPGEWIIGSGWHAPALTNAGVPIADAETIFTKDRLDAATSNHPVALIDLSCHSVWANTAALRASGIDPDKPLLDEYVVTDSANRPSGLFKESAQSLIFAAMPPRDPRLVQMTLAAGVARLNALGITSITEPGLGAGGTTFLGAAAGPEVIAAYAELASRAELSLRVNVLLLPSPAPQSSAGLTQGLDRFELGDHAAASERLLRIAGVKIFADGVPMLHTSCFVDPYTDLGNESGSLAVAGDTHAERKSELHELIRIAHERGYQVGVHATGDRTADLVVEGFLRAMQEHTRTDTRHYVIHGSFASAEALARLGNAGLGMNWSPEIHASYAEANIQVVGEDRVRRFGPVQTALQAGVRVACSSDAPIGAADWRGALAALIDRRTAQGTQLGEDQQITLLEGLRTYTVTGAWQDHAETWKGSIQPGMVADLVLVEGDMLHMTPDEIRTLKILRTYFEGALVYSA